MLNTFYCEVMPAWKVISFFTGTVSKICFPFRSIEFIHEKERQETDGKTAHTGFQTMPFPKFSNHFITISTFACFMLSSNIIPIFYDRLLCTHRRGTMKGQRPLEGQASPSQRSRGEQPQTEWWLAGSDYPIQTSNLSPWKEEEK